MSYVLLSSIPLDGKSLKEILLPDLIDDIFVKYVVDDEFMVYSKLKSKYHLSTWFVENHVADSADTHFIIPVSPCFFLLKHLTPSDIEKRSISFSELLGNYEMDEEQSLVYGFLLNKAFNDLCQTISDDEYKLSKELIDMFCKKIWKIGEKYGGSVSSDGFDPNMIPDVLGLFLSPKWIEYSMKLKKNE
eukprot:TRINITY_DN2033_c0_g1_i1.p1 TRINITY_DN2033_c0_g1~~TRINITY_DN2033_c0_g1_i1.p1  ORF type:complete len:189 (+),score=55.24 TRINITY_DN2033_c0_g1_i1:611-1177(+)